MRLTLALAVILSLASSLRAQTPTASTLTLEAALARARETNPRILAARRGRAVGEAGVGVARDRLNPEVSYEAEKETPRQSISVLLPIELGGKRARRIDSANAGVAVADAEIARVTAEVENDVRRAYFEAVAANGLLALAEEVRILATRARDAAAARVAAGDVPRLEAVQTELALADADNDVTGAAGEAAAARATLNALLGEPTTRLFVPADASILRPLPAYEDVLSRATQANFELASFDRRITEQAARRDLATALGSPDLSVGSSLTFNAQPEFSYGWRASFGVSLPLFTRHRAGVVLEDAELARLTAERSALAASVAGTVAAAYARATAAAQQLARYQNDILPRVVEVEAMAQDAYTSGQSGVAALLQLLSTTRDARRRGLEVGLDFERALADLERAGGISLR